VDCACCCFPLVCRNQLFLPGFGQLAAAAAVVAGVVVFFVTVATAVASQLPHGTLECNGGTTWVAATAWFGAVVALLLLVAGGAYLLGLSWPLRALGMVVMVWTFWGWLGVIAMADGRYADCSSAMLDWYLALSVLSGCGGTLALLVWFAWHRLTRRRDGGDTSRGMCFLGTCVLPCAQMSGLKRTVFCHYFSCNVPTVEKEETCSRTTEKPPLPAAMTFPGRAMQIHEKHHSTSSIGTSSDGSSVARDEKSRSFQ
jgi:hypothetical protein